jgi:hypothetical protein
VSGTTNPAATTVLRTLFVKPGCGEPAIVSLAADTA